jgi:hypothetical protein
MCCRNDFPPSTPEGSANGSTSRVGSRQKGRCFVSSPRLMPASLPPNQVASPARGIDFETIFVYVLVAGALLAEIALIAGLS